jgi:DNA-directed RNA polymerase sigma subunit (sigma70/sigma32)
MSLDELGERLSINKESVRYRKAKIINKLRRKAA